MSRSISLALLAVGVLLIIWGINASESVSSQFTELFKGRPTNEAIWLLVGGVAAAIIGLFGFLRGSKTR